MHRAPRSTRCRLSRTDASLEQTLALVNATALVLGRFASEPHKEPRAPQNLHPIAGLEHLLRHRIGDRDGLERALRDTVGQKHYGP